MGILPKIDFLNFDVEKEKEEIKTNGKTFLIDFKSGKMLRDKGRLIKTDDERAVRMWLEKILITEKNKWLIYKNYGMNYKKNITGRRFPTPVLYSEFIRELKETISKNKQILEIKDIEINLVRHTLNTKFKIVLIDFKEFLWESFL